MAKVMAVTDRYGALLGVVRADLIDAGNGVTIQAVPIERADQRHHFVEVPDALLTNKKKMWVEELHREVERRLIKP
jgi:hypothetical protein